MAVIDKWYLFWGYFILLNECLSNYDLYLQGGLYSQVVFDTGVTVISLVNVMVTIYSSPFDAVIYSYIVLML